jgi:hypothetical protein
MMQGRLRASPLLENKKMNPGTFAIDQITSGLTDWILPMLFTVASSIITIMMIVLAGTLIVGLLKGGDFLSMGVGSVIGSIKRSYEDYGEGAEYQKVLGEEKRRIHTSGLRERARAELRGKE